MAFGNTASKFQSRIEFKVVSICVKRVWSRQHCTRHFCPRRTLRYKAVLQAKQYRINLERFLRLKYLGAGGRTFSKRGLFHEALQVQKLQFMPQGLPLPRCDKLRKMFTERTDEITALNYIYRVKCPFVMRPPLVRLW